jgi:YidC/Oxa1 family membrane protein insertase
LRISSYKSTLKMQRVAPEIKQIQDKYKKYSMRDPRKAEMNKEVMAVYSREGINPVGGCFQMFLQMPIWIGLNTTLRYAIEMRHARWFGWITDEDHASNHGGHFHDLTDFQRLGGVYSHQQPCGHLAAVVAESHASRERRAG